MECESGSHAPPTSKQDGRFGYLRAIIIADELEEAYAVDEEIVDLVRQLRREKLTNIGRFFSLDILTVLHFILKADG
jgi:hypothetical protein